VTGSTDGIVRVWDAASGAELRRLEGHGGEVWSAAFSPDGRWIVTGSTDGIARVWDWRTRAALPGNLLQRACRSLPMKDGTRDLSLGDLAAEIGLPDLPDITPCDSYDPPMPADMR
ncbi:MAG: hypothetical protein AAF565_18030, partial [Pseudomonadota bacterium]